MSLHVSKRLKVEPEKLIKDIETFSKEQGLGLLDGIVLYSLFQAGKENRTPTAFELTHFNADPILNEASQYVEESLPTSTTTDEVETILKKLVEEGHAIPAWHYRDLT